MKKLISTHDKVSAAVNRRCFLGKGVGTLGLAALLQQSITQAKETDVQVPRWPGILNGKLHHQATAKRVIFLTMAGGMSHLETFDHRPKLAEMDGKPMPESYTKGQPIAQLQNKPLKCLAPQHPFAKHG